ncbi:MAG TPA: hypothetical protein VGQ82_00015 [Chthoniobacterales bacterium]|nr:hypothetical protein [Chthoniobacterales bacterium]
MSITFLLDLRFKRRNRSSTLYFFPSKSPEVPENRQQRSNLRHRSRPQAYCDDSLLKRAPSLDVVLHLMAEMAVHPGVDAGVIRCGHGLLPWVK